MPHVFGIEGLDRLGKSTLIEGIQERLGFFQVIHFGKPKKLKAYEKDVAHLDGVPLEKTSEFLYQRTSFTNSMILAKSGAQIIFDRWHLGEAVYSPIYRGYGGDYVFDIEKNAEMHFASGVRLILLVEDFDRSTHFKSDGESFDDTKRRDEQALFIQAFKRSSIKDKRLICVTALDGNFRSKGSILNEALA